MSGNSTGKGNFTGTISSGSATAFGSGLNRFAQSQAVLLHKPCCRQYSDTVKLLFQYSDNACCQRRHTTLRFTIAVPPVDYGDEFTPAHAGVTDGDGWTLTLPLG